MKSLSYHWARACLGLASLSVFTGHKLVDAAETLDALASLLERPARRLTLWDDIRKAVRR